MNLLSVMPQLPHWLDSQSMVAGFGLLVFYASYKLITNPNASESDNNLSIILLFVGLFCTGYGFGLIDSDYISQIIGE